MFIFEGCGYLDNFVLHQCIRSSYTVLRGSFLDKRRENGHSSKGWKYFRTRSNENRKIIRYSTLYSYPHFQKLPDAGWDKKRKFILAFKLENIFRFIMPPYNVIFFTIYMMACLLKQA